MSPIVAGYIAPLVCSWYNLKTVLKKTEGEESWVPIWEIKKNPACVRRATWRMPLAWRVSLTGWRSQNSCSQGCRPAPLHSPFPIMLHPSCRIYMVISSSGPLGASRKDSLQSGTEGMSDRSWHPTGAAQHHGGVAWRCCRSAASSPGQHLLSLR